MEIVAETKEIQKMNWMDLKLMDESLAALELSKKRTNSKESLRQHCLSGRNPQNEDKYIFSLSVYIFYFP